MTPLKNSGRYLLQGILALMTCGGAQAGTARQVSQYGITWTFDKSYPVGQFVNGDYWVVGPVEILSVIPAPGSSKSNVSAQEKSRYGATALVDDRRMRNGSMIIEKPEASSGDKTGFGLQGYDSRALNYSPDRSVQFPCSLKTNRSLISTISSETYNNGKLATPYLLGEKDILMCKPTAPVALRAAAVLTCLKSAPPPNAFRPPYAGTQKPIYRAGDIQWNLLPDLPALQSSPDWDVMECIFERPWLDHISSWLIQHTFPGENGPHYGREFARMSSLAALMLLQDVPRKTKETLMIRYLQLGIDLSGLAQCGRQWFSDGGHWQGRKWPILFASLMLDDDALRTFPPVDLSRAVYGRARVLASDAVKRPTTFFQEDLDYYYGQGGDGQNTLWQMVWHTGPRPPYQEIPRADLSDKKKFADGYRLNNVASGVGVALAAQLMGAKAIWSHEAFFDYMDYWMTEAPEDVPEWLPQGATRVYDLFVEKMWDAYRDSVPDQPAGASPVKWVWKKGSTGCWEANPRLPRDAVAE